MPTPNDLASRFQVAPYEPEPAEALDPDLLADVGVFIDRECDQVANHRWTDTNRFHRSYTAWAYKFGFVPPHGGGELQRVLGALGYRVDVVRNKTDQEVEAVRGVFLRHGAFVGPEGSAA